MPDRRHILDAIGNTPLVELCVMPNAGHGVLPQELILAFLQETSATVRQDGG